jgi:hypothetical protein
VDISRTQDEAGQEFQIPRPGMEVERCTMVALCMALMLILVVGSAGYACIHPLLSTVTVGATALRSGNHIDERNRETDSDRLVTPAAIVLGLLALFSVAVPANPSRVKDSDPFG